MSELAAARALRTGRDAMTHSRVPRDRVARHASRAGEGPLFPSVICAADRSAAGHAACQHAAVLAAGAEVEHITTPRPGRASASLLDRCDGADLLVLADHDEVDGVFARASLPVLVARGSSPGTSVTDRILMAVDEGSDPQHAAEIVGRLASRRSSELAVVSIPARNRALERATAATSRIVTQVAGIVPQVYGRPVRGDRAILSAVESMEASLLVLPLGRTARARRDAALVTRLLTCSVLAIPELQDGGRSGP
jgi:hypothetical protein